MREVAEIVNLDTWMSKRRDFAIVISESIISLPECSLQTGTGEIEFKVALSTTPGDSEYFSWDLFYKKEEDAHMQIVYLGLWDDLGEEYDGDGTYLSADEQEFIKEYVQPWMPEGIKDAAYAAYQRIGSKFDPAPYCEWAYAAGRTLALSKYAQEGANESNI